MNKREAMKWSPAENRTLIAMKADGATLDAMGEQVNRTRNAVQAQLRKLGIYNLMPVRKDQPIMAQIFAAPDDHHDDEQKAIAPECDHDGFLEALAKHHPKHCMERKVTARGTLFLVKSGGFELLPPGRVG